MTAIVSSH